MSGDGAAPQHDRADAAAGVGGEHRRRDPSRSRRRLDLLGWVTFLLCALAFLAVGVRDSDALTVVASVLFLVGVLLFLVSMLVTDRDR